LQFPNPALWGAKKTPGSLWAFLPVDQRSAPLLAAGYLLSVICKQQEAASLIQEEIGEWVVETNNHSPS
jgi:hypothetical protein